jgi:hypothetical protein
MLTGNPTELPIAPSIRVTPVEAAASLAAQQAADEHPDIVDALRCEHCFLYHPGVLCWTWDRAEFYENGAIKSVVYNKARAEHVRSLCLDSLEDDDVPVV